MASGWLNSSIVKPQDTGSTGCSGGQEMGTTQDWERTHFSALPKLRSGRIQNLIPWALLWWTVAPVGHLSTALPAVHSGEAKRGGQSRTGDKGEEMVTTVIALVWEAVTTQTRK